MKKWIVILLTIVSCSTYAQNLVTNGNFEYYTTCPGSISATANCTPWRSYHAGSSDYFHGCNTSLMPSNFFGYQTPASGNGYVGGYSFTSISTLSTYTEYVAAPITPMAIGSTYEVSISVSLSNNSKFGNNGLGVWFYDVGPTSTIAGTATISVTPQVNFISNGNIIDTQNWVRLTAVYTADSAYDNIVIGKFDPSGGLSTTGIGTPPGFSYYYIDSVVVKLINGINNLYTDSMICAGDTFQLPYTLNSASVYTSTNVFTAQLSNSSGSFASGTTTIGTRTGNTAGNITCVVPNTITPGNNYRIRILSTNTLDSSAANAKDISIGVTRPNVSNSNNSPICSGQTLNLTASSSTTGVTYKWTGPNNFISTLQNPTIAPAPAAANGNYIVTARLFGCLAKDTTTATVVNVLASVSAGTTTPICERDTLQLNATVSGTPNSYSWAGPNSFTSTAKDTNIINALPAASGDYIISVNYTGCTVKDTVSVLVKPLAAGRSISSNSPVCTDNTLTLAASSSSTGVGYTWSGPNSFVSTLSTVSINNVTLSAAGNYIMTYTLNGCFVKDTVTVVINQSPVPVTAGVNTPICELETMNLTSTTSTSGASYSWTGPGGYTSSLQNPSRTNTTAAMSGDYIVTASLSNGCTKKDTVTALVKPLPANFNATTNAPICEGSSLQVNGNTSSTGVSFVWTGPNGFSSTLQNPGILSSTPAATGNYIVTGTLNGCIMKDTVFAQVTPTPATPVAGSNSPVCTSQPINLTASTVSGATYQWTGPGGYSVTAQNPVRTGATSLMAGIYTVRAMINNCLSLPANTTVAIITAPSINLYPSPNDSICVGSTVVFVATPNNGGSSPQYQWYRNNNLIPGASGTSYSTTGAADMDEYFCSITATGVCANPFTDSSNKIQMRVFPYLAPSVSITANPNTTVASGTMINFTATPVNAGNFPKYQWTRNGVNVVGALSNLWGANSLSNGDVICTEITSNYLCPNPTTAKSNCIKVSIETTGISGTNISNKQPAIYPNPTKDKLIIEGITKGTRIQLNDVLGRTLQTQTAANETETLNLQALIPGNYILQLSYANGDRMTVKVVKE